MSELVDQLLSFLFFNLLFASILSTVFGSNAAGYRGFHNYFVSLPPFGVECGGTNKSAPVSEVTWSQ